MSDPEGGAADAAEKLSAREAYLRNQQAVATAKPMDHRRWTPLRIAALIAALLTAGLYVATVVSYYNNPQEEGPTNIDLPTATSFAALATVLLLVLPFLLEARTIAARVRNILIAAVLAFGLALICIAVFIELGSLVADLIYNLGH
jgi:hypothetical protein